MFMPIRTALKTLSAAFSYLLQYVMIPFLHKEDKGRDLEAQCLAVLVIRNRHGRIVADLGIG